MHQSQTLIHIHLICRLLLQSYAVNDERMRRSSLRLSKDKNNLLYISIKIIKIHLEKKTLTLEN